MRKIQFANGYFYHIFNRGVDKRSVVLSVEDTERFLKSIQEFNCTHPIGSIFENSFLENKPHENTKPLVNIICYCINPNHYHMLVEQLIDNGIEKLMHRISTGYTKYFNQKYHRTGSLFQGPYKAVEIDTNEYLLHVSSYINLNQLVHKLKNKNVRLSKSSWDEYIKNKKNLFCKKNIILKQFDSKKNYEKFALEALAIAQEQKQKNKEFECLLLE